MKQTRVLVFMGLFISMDIILRRILSIQTPIVRVDFAFIPVAFSAMLLGPFIGGVTAALADILGMMIFPKGPYFPGFTFSALLTGAIYGFFLYGKPKTAVRVFWATLTVILLVELGLNTIWLSMIFNKAVAAIVTARLVKSLIMLPTQTMMVYVLWRYAGSYAENGFMHRRRI